MDEYTVTLRIDTLAESFEDAARSFKEYVACQNRFCVVVTRNAPDGRVEDVAEVEV